MKRIIFSGLIAIGLTFSVNAFAQESVRSRQIKNELDQTTHRMDRDMRNSADTLRNEFTRTRSEMRHRGDTLRNEYDRTRSRMDHTRDTLRNEYDRTRNDLRRERDQMQHRADSIRRNDPFR